MSEGVWVRQYFTRSDTQGFIQGVLKHAQGPWVPLAPVGTALVRDSEPEAGRPRLSTGTTGLLPGGAPSWRAVAAGRTPSLRPVVRPSRWLGGCEKASWACLQSRGFYKCPQARVRENETSSVLKQPRPHSAGPDVPCSCLIPATPQYEIILKCFWFTNVKSNTSQWNP